MRLTFTNTEENTEEQNEGSSFLGGSVLGASLIAGSFLPTDKEQEQEEENDKLYGNYRGTRYIILEDHGAYMTLGMVKGSETLSVSSCNVSDVSTSPTTHEVICPGDNQCRRKGLRQGPNCVPIKPSEGLLRYPHPI